MFTTGLVLFLGSFIFAFRRWGTPPGHRERIIKDRDNPAMMVFLALFFGGSVLMVLKIIVLMWTYLF